MEKSVIVYQADQEVIGKHVRSNQWIMYSGKLTIYNRAKNPICLKLKSEIYDSFLSIGMDDKKEFKGDSVTEVYAKLSKWYYNRGILFKN